MATQDISRSASDFRKRYHGVQLQQGRVLADDDFNEADRLATEVRRRTAVELVGAHGTSNAGFAISDARITAGGELDFAIGAGSLFVGGLRAEQRQRREQQEERERLLQRRFRDPHEVAQLRRDDRRGIALRGADGGHEGVGVGTE